MMKKFAIATAALLAFALTAGAQNATIEQEYTQFTAVEVANSFEVTLVNATNYSTKIVVDQLIKDYVQAYVKGNTLFLDVDTKSYPPEVKKMMKGKNAYTPSLKVEIGFPMINKLTVKDKAQVMCEGNLKSDVFHLIAQDNAQVKSLTIDTQDMKINASNKAYVRGDIYTNEMTLDSSNSADVNLAMNCQVMNLGTAGSSNTTVNGKITQARVKSQGSSVITLTGTGAKLVVEGSASSSVYTDGIVVRDAEITLTNSAVCEVNAKENLKVDLQGSSNLIFNGSPSVDVVRIINSTMTRTGDSKNKKAKK